MLPGAVWFSGESANQLYAGDIEGGSEIPNSAGPGFDIRALIEYPARQSAKLAWFILLGPKTRWSMAQDP
jgi:hypothetical protein